MILIAFDSIVGIYFFVDVVVVVVGLVMEYQLHMDNKLMDSFYYDIVVVAQLLFDNHIFVPVG